jgi:hypothetical protein
MIREFLPEYNSELESSNFSKIDGKQALWAGIPFDFSGFSAPDSEGESDEMS